MRSPRPHTSAGRLPTELGLRFFVDALMQVGDLAEQDRKSIESQVAAARHGQPLESVLAEASQMLSGLTRSAGIVLTAKNNVRLKHVEFVRLEPERALAVLVAEDGQVENRVLQDEIVQKAIFEEIVGSSTALRNVLQAISKVAPTDSTVLITGETGTGKELVAHAIHKRSPRSNRALVKVNCAALPAELIASELFGHEKGAFTGALTQRIASGCSCW